MTRTMMISGVERDKRIDGDNVKYLLRQLMKIILDHYW